jgi:hypothetical protein
MIVALSLTITGSLDIFEGHPKSGSYTQWKVGTVLIAVAWAFQVLWSLFSLLPSRGSKGSPGYHGGTAVSLPKECQVFFNLWLTTVSTAHPGCLFCSSLPRCAGYLWYCLCFHPETRSQSDLWITCCSSRSHVSS